VSTTETPKDPPAAKPAAPAAARKLRSSEDSGEKAVAPLKQKTLPTGLSRAVVISTIFASAVIAVSTIIAGRYDLVPAPNSTNSYMYRIDRLTGDILFCGPQACTDVVTKAGEK
jgi:hypothetical protein